MQFSFIVSLAMMDDVHPNDLPLLRGAVLHETATVMGWTGAALVLLGYWLMVTGRIRATGAKYLAANVLGSLCLAVSTLQAHAWQSAVVNVLWMAFGAGPLIKALQSRTARRRASCPGRAYRTFGRRQLRHSDRHRPRRGRRAAGTSPRRLVRSARPHS